MEKTLALSDGTELSINDMGYKIKSGIFGASFEARNPCEFVISCSYGVNVTFSSDVICKRKLALYKAPHILNVRHSICPFYFQAECPIFKETLTKGTEE